MKIVLQRVSHASVDVDGTRMAEIEQGLLLLVGIVDEDVRVNLGKTAQKIADLRVFEDEAHKMNRSLRDIKGSILAVSQFTLCGDTSKGRRPSFVKAARPDIAEPLFDAFVDALRAEGVPTQTGRFGAKMNVQLINDGPVTLILEVEAVGTSG